jgi:transmembrane sensor
MKLEERDMPMHPTEPVAMEADRWLARLRSPDCRADDRASFQEWLARHPTHWQAYNHAEHLWLAAAQARDPEMNALADSILLRARQRRQSAPRRARMLGWAAAVVLMFGAVAGVMEGGWLTTKPATLTYSTAIGEIRSFTLPDSSVITLNTDTVLQVSMGTHARAVNLRRGEAQFKVAHDPQRPFTVTTPQVVVTDIGTVFQVRDTGASTEVLLLEGRVQVMPADSRQQAVQRQDLVPGDRLLAKADTPWLRSRANLDAANGWVSGRLVFDSTPLRQAVEEFNRYSRRKLRIADRAIGDIRIDGVFNAGDIDSITLALQAAYPLRVEDRGFEIVLHHR